MNKTRRTFVRMLMAFAVGAPLASRIAPIAFAAPPATKAGAEGFFIVNGWVLTRADLDALQIDAV